MRTTATLTHAAETAAAARRSRNARDDHA